MAESEHVPQCPSCGHVKTDRRFTMPRVIVKGSKESPQKSVERLGKTKRQSYDCPWVDAETGKRKRVFRKGGEDKAAFKRRIQDVVLNTKMARKRNLTRNDVQPGNI